MVRKTFEMEIQQVKDDVLILGSMVEKALLDSVEALKKRDIKAAERLFLEDKEINKKRFEIENHLMILIATQQPMAHDLRLLASSLEIISELERMGDYAKGISNINIRMGDCAPSQAADRCSAHGAKGRGHAAPLPDRLCQRRCGNGREHPGGR